MAKMVGARPFRDFEPMLLPESHARALTGWVYQLLGGPLGTDSHAVASGVGLVLASARSGHADLPRIADAVGCKAEALASGLTSLVGHSVARRSADGFAPLMPGEDLRSLDDLSVRYVSAGVQVLAASASVNRWRDPGLMHVGAALVVLSAPSAVRPRRPVATWRVAGVCGTSLPLTCALLRDLALRHAAVGVGQHLPTVPDGLQ